LHSVKLRRAFALHLFSQKAMPRQQGGKLPLPCQGGWIPIFLEAIELRFVEKHHTHTLKEG